uniref:HNH endonuclease n=1 Tax=Pseudonocardia sp. CA-138482 TaxID=3240023 RepID=UPI003F494464
MKEHAARPILAVRSGGLCEMCTGARPTEAHHRKNRSQGGTWALSNLLHLCHACHAWVTEHPRQAHDEGGWAVWQHEDSADVPVLMRRYRSWMWLDDEGMLTFADWPPLAA